MQRLSNLLKKKNECFISWQDLVWNKKSDLWKSWSVVIIIGDDDFDGDLNDIGRTVLDADDHGNRLVDLEKNRFVYSKQKPVHHLTIKMHDEIKADQTPILI